MYTDTSVSVSVSLSLSYKLQINTVILYIRKQVPRLNNFQSPAVTEVAELTSAKIHYGHLLFITFVTLHYIYSLASISSLNNLFLSKNLLILIFCLCPFITSERNALPSAQHQIQVPEPLNKFCTKLTSSPLRNQQQLLD